MPDDVGAHLPRPPTPPVSPFARLVDGVLEKVMAAAVIWGATRASAIVNSIADLKAEVEKVGYVLQLKTEHDLDQDGELKSLHERIEVLEKKATRTLPVK